MNGWLCLGLASGIAAALFGQSAIAAAISAGFAASLPSDPETAEGRARLRVFGRQYARGPLYMAAALFAASAAGAFITTGLK